MKRNLLSRCAVLILALVMVISLAACQSNAPEETSVSPTAEPTAEPTPEPTPEPTAEPTPEPTTEPEPEPENINILTGLPTLTDEAVGKRPVAVMINNVDAALPQYGIAQADILFEIPVEGDQTRLMGVYGDYTQVPDICSVRSCRYYYPILALSFDSIYIHWGIDPTIATETVNRLDLDHYDGLNGGPLYSRDQDRLNSGYALEHTGAFHGGNLPAQLEKNAVRTDLKEDWQDYAFNFAPWQETIEPQGESAGSIQVDFGAMTSRFNYNAETHQYEKFHGSNPHVDVRTGEQLAFENVVVLETEISVRDDKGRKNVNWKGGNDHTGYYFTEGVMQPITWSKADEYSKLELFDANGEPLTLNRGKTYIGITYYGYTETGSALTN